jgi:hypothetical protein
MSNRPIDPDTSGALIAETADDPWSDADRQEWSRHYDTLHWGVIGLGTAGVSALFAVSFSVDDGHVLWPELGGLWVLVVTMFFVASFRTFRARLHESINNAALRAFLKNPSGSARPHQWDLFAGTFVLAALIFTFQAVIKAERPYGPLVLGVVAISVLAKLWRGDSRHYRRDDRIVDGHLRVVFDPARNIVSVVGDATGLEALSRICLTRVGGPPWLSAPNVLSGSHQLRIAYEASTVASMSAVSPEPSLRTGHLPGEEQ